MINNWDEISQGIMQISNNVGTNISQALSNNTPEGSSGNNGGGDNEMFYTDRYGNTMSENNYNRYVTNANGFKNVKGLQDFKSRIPENAIELPWREVSGGARDGVKYRWTDNEGNLWNTRAHSIDPSAPEGSNASKGWIYRLEVRWGGNGKTYYMDDSGNYHPENAMRNNSPIYNPDIANNTHIPLE